MNRRKVLDFRPMVEARAGPSAAEPAIHRILQEARRNVAAHAGARLVRVALTTVAPRPGSKDVRQRGAIVQLSIADDGAGFDPKRVSAAGAATANLGLLSMSERATSVGGTLLVRSAPGRGTTVRVRVPV